MNSFWKAFEQASQTKDNKLASMVKTAMKDKINGGEASKMSDESFDKKELAEGAKIEAKEHTDGNKEIGKEIAKDHIVENQQPSTDGKIRSDYYKELPKFEQGLKKSASMKELLLDELVKLRK